LEHKATDAMPPEVVGDDVAAPLLRQVPPAENLLAAVLWAAGVEPLHDAHGADGRGVVGAGQDVVDALAAGAVGDERLTPAVEVVAPRVDPAAGEHVELQRLGAELPDAPGEEPPRAVRRFDVAVDVDRLV